ncbi:hypothetical protein IT575_02620 [bacterium]|nr:hypothetical protein [bacterium]
MLLYNSMILLSIQGFKPLAEAGDKTAIEKLEMNRSFLVLGKIGLGIAALILIFVLLQRLLNHLDYTKQSRNS